MSVIMASLQGKRAAGSSRMGNERSRTHCANSGRLLTLTIRTTGGRADG